MNALAATLSPFQRRLYAAVESVRLGRSGDRTVAEVLGICPAVISRGRKELAGLAAGVWPEAPEPCGGRPRTETRCPALLAALEKMVKDEIAGDSVKDVKWVRSSANKLAARLRAMGFTVSSTTVWRLLKRLGYSMRINIRRWRGHQPDSPERNQQFEYLGARRREGLAAGSPVISIDTKNKELIGDFMTKGRAWCKRPHEVNDHDLSSLAECRAVPFGIYDLRRNRGHVVVGLSNDTPEFVVACIARWWRTREPRSTRTRTRCSCWRNAAGPTVIGAGRGSRTSRSGCATGSGSGSRSVTTHRAARSGTRSSTGCSARSA